MAEDTGPGSLKLAIGISPGRALGGALERALAAHVAQHNVRRAGEHAVLVFTGAPGDEIRSWLNGVLEPDESLLVLEFERWSSAGDDIDARWLLRRGH